MARWKFPLLATLAWTFLAVPSLLGERGSPKPSSCKQQQVRYRTPPLEALPWPGYWVPLMIILGGCCALAWCILYVTYDIGQRGEKDRLQLPGPPEEPAGHLDGRKAWSKTLFQADADIPNMETGSSPWLESTVDGEKMASRAPLQSKSTNVGLGSAPWLGENLPSEAERSIIQLERKPTSKRTGVLTQPPESQAAAEEARSFTHFENHALRERPGSPTPLENNPASERVDSAARLERCLAGSEQEKARSVAPSAQGGPAFQEGPSPWPGQDGEENGSRHLWTFMEKELERLLGALRRHRAHEPACLEEQAPDPPSEEPPAPPPSAAEAPSPPPAAEVPDAQAGVAPGFWEGTDIKPCMFFIIPEVPRSPSRSPARGRGCKRRCASKRRK